MVTLPVGVLERYPRFSRYNSPYPEHDAGTAIDLYPDRDDQVAPSPVDGVVVETRTVRCPPKPYAVDHDHLLVVDTGDHLARILHVDPSVDTGDRVAVGDPLGHLVRSGFFAPWVANHLHVAYRPLDANPLRATGSLPLDLAPTSPIEPVPWDGTGTVVETGDTWVLLDGPAHPDPGRHFAGIATDDGRSLDGGLPHYDHGGVRGAGGGPGAGGGDDADTVALLGTVVGDVTDGLAVGDRRRVDWRDVRVTANDVSLVGLSLFFGRERLGAKLVCPDHDWAPGEAVRVRIE
jgi:hypothetical protein